MGLLENTGFGERVGRGRKPKFEERRMKAYRAVLLFLVLAGCVAGGRPEKEPARSSVTSASAETPRFPGRVSDWKGYKRFDFKLFGRACRVVVPKKEAPGRPWIWRARFFGHEPQVDLALLARGWHLVYIDVAGLYGAPVAVKLWDRFYLWLVQKRGFARRAVLEGMSRGGLIIFNWAKKNPDKTAAVYGDAPVCDLRSWPGGKGAGRGSRRCWKECLRVWGLTEESVRNFHGNPLDGLGPMAKAGVPVLVVYGEADKVVPPAENCLVLARRYRRLGGEIRLIGKPGVGHHPHCLKDPKPIVDFILEHWADRATGRRDSSR